jgi:predicted RNA polymerase sigma factor
VTAGEPIEDLLRVLAPRVLGTLAHRDPDFADCEDAVQEALLAAALQWPVEGRPDNPQAWLIAVAVRRLSDARRADSARRAREHRQATLKPTDALAASGMDDPARSHDDTLTLLFLCCHPALSPASQLALTLRAVGGLTTAEIARAFLVPDATMAQRISRAKQRVRATGISFRMPSPDEQTERVRVVLHVLYLIFTEGHTSTTGPVLHRDDLTREAIRLTRLVRELLPDDGEVAGLLALMLLTDARRAARTGAGGALIPLPDQDRTLWDAEAIDEGVRLVTATLGARPLGPYQVQAAIAALHAEGGSTHDTDWPQILMLYRVLEELSPNPMTRLNYAVAAAMVHGPATGLALVDELAREGQLTSSHRINAVRGHLLEMSGDPEGARSAYLAAARQATSIPEQRYLKVRASRLSQECSVEA